MRAVIIEDELRSQNVLISLLKLRRPEVEVAGCAGSVVEGLALIETLSPEMVFLDIHLSDGSGFDILEQMKDLKLNVIFTTAYDKYAIRAFKFSAIDYLLKPIDADELEHAVMKCQRMNKFNLNQTQLTGLLNNLKLKSHKEPTISISTSDSIEYIRIRDIIRCEAQGAYSAIHLMAGKKIIMSKVIKELEAILTEYEFCRIHQTHLVNLSEIEKYLRRENKVKMSDGTKLPLARSRKERFFQSMDSLRHP